MLSLLFNLKSWQKNESHLLAGIRSVEFRLWTMKTLELFLTKKILKMSYSYGKYHDIFVPSLFRLDLP